MLSLVLVLLAQVDSGVSVNVNGSQYSCSLGDGGHWTDFCSVIPDPHIDGGHVINCTLPVYANRFATTEDQRAAGHVIHRWSANNGLTMPAFLVGASQNGAPSLGTMPGKVNEMYGFTEYGDAGVYQRSGFEIYCLGPEGEGRAVNGNSCLGIGTYPSSDKAVWFDNQGNLTMGRILSLTSDNNENIIRTVGTRGPNFASRLRLSASDPSAGGVAVYITEEPFTTGGVPFQVLFPGTTFGTTSEGGLVVGRVWTLPTCNSSSSATVLYHIPQQKFVGCDGTNWVAF